MSNNYNNISFGDDKQFKNEKEMTDFIIAKSPLTKTYLEQYGVINPNDGSYDLEKIGGIILENDALRNEWITNIANKIGITYIKVRTLENPLARFIKDPMQVGQYVEEIALRNTEKYEYKAEYNADKLFSIEKQQAVSVYHPINRRDQYKLTKHWEEIKGAFQSFEKMAQFVDSVITGLTNSDKRDMYFYTRNIFAQAYDTVDKFMKVEVTAPTDSKTSNNLLVEIKSILGHMQFPTDKFNPSELEIQSDPKDLVFFTTPEVSARIDVSSFAQAFNRDDRTFKSEMVTVDDFGKTKNGDKIIGVIASKDFFQIHPQTDVITQYFNEQGLYYNIFLTKRGVVSFSQMENVVYLIEKGEETKPDPEPTDEKVTLTVKHTDQNGDSVVDDVVSELDKGSEYTTEPVEKEGYTLSETPENATGTIETDTTVEYKYTKAEPETKKRTTRVKKENN